MLKASKYGIKFCTNRKYQLLFIFLIGFDGHGILKMHKTRNYNLLSLLRLCPNLYSAAKYYNNMTLHIYLHRDRFLSLYL